MAGLPPIRTFLRPTLAAIAAAGGECSNDQIRLTVAQRLALSEEQILTPHGSKGNRTELEYRLAWARTTLRTAGHVQAAGPRRWRLTTGGWDQIGSLESDWNTESP
jgi:restriction system protein